MLMDRVKILSFCASSTIESMSYITIQTEATAA